MLGSQMSFGYQMGGVPGGTGIGNILRGLGGALFGGQVGQGGTPASTAAQQSNKDYWMGVGSGLANSLINIVSGIFSKDKTGTIQQPNGLLTTGNSYQTQSIGISFLGIASIITLIVWGVKSIFSGKKRY